MQIIIRRVPQEEQRYETLGDWFYDDTGTLLIKATAEDEDGAFLIALHELVEAWLCRKAGVSQQQVDEFDNDWTGVHPEYPLESDEEPGDDSGAPYRKQHRFAMIIEHLMARELGIDNYGVIR